MCRDQTGCAEIHTSTCEAGQAHGQRVQLAAEPGPGGWRKADLAAIGRPDGGPAVLCDWISTWTQAVVPPKTAKLWTAPTIAPLDCGPKKAEPGQTMQQPCPRKLRPIALAEVLVKLAESCVMEQHIEKLLHEPGVWHA